MSFNPAGAGNNHMRDPASMANGISAGLGVSLRSSLRFVGLVVCFAFCLASCAGHPQPVPPWLRPAEKPRDENYHGGPVAMLLKFDANHDGTLTREELIAGLKAEFAADDTKHTGCLDKDEVIRINQQRVEEDGSTATPLVDWNQDGCIDYTEFSAEPYSLFDQLDRNGDGKLTPRELGVPKKAPSANQSRQAEVGQ